MKTKKLGCCSLKTTLCVALGMVILTSSTTTSFGKGGRVSFIREVIASVAGAFVHDKLSEKKELEFEYEQSLDFANLHIRRVLSGNNVKFRLTFDSLRNNSDSVFEDLKINVWACEKPYKDGSISGHILAVIPIIDSDGLKPNHYYYSYERTANIDVSAISNHGPKHIVVTATAKKKNTDEMYFYGWENMSLRYDPKTKRWVK